ncbi:unnamed protein product, partial [marine sediment metagenome]
VSTSRIVSTVTGFPVQPNKAIVGANAFAHESGIHQDGILKARETYEIIRAEDVGWAKNKIVLGKHSGRNALRSRLHDLGILIKEKEELSRIFIKFKNLADRKHEIYDEDLHALVAGRSLQDKKKYQLVALQACSEIGKKPYAKITLLINGMEMNAEVSGSGPVDATFCAIEKIATSRARLQLYSVNNITKGTDAQGEVTVRLKKDRRIVNGHGADTDIIIASAKAYLHALNKLAQPETRAHPQHDI